MIQRLSTIVSICGRVGTSVPTSGRQSFLVGTSVSAGPRLLLLLVFILLQGTYIYADILPDDHGNTVADATAMAGGSNSITGQIEFDTDTDYFSFPFQPARSYVIQVMTGTVWDVELSVTPPAWTTPYVLTNTVRTSPVDINWTNNGASANWYLSVEGMFEYTTGSYHLAVWESPFDQDTDGDGMTDSWEVNELGSITNEPGDDYDQDGQSNLQEFFAQTQADDANSAVQVDWLDVEPDGDLVGWYQAAFSTYKVYTATNIYGPWEYLEDRVADETGGSIQWTNDTGEDVLRFYRVDFVH